MTTITTTRALLEQALEALEASRRFVYQDSRPQVDAAFDALNTELAKPAEPVEQVEPVAWIYGIPGHKNAASCERIPLDMCPRGTTEAPLYLHPPTPAWHDAPEVATLKAERDELLSALKPFADTDLTESIVRDTFGFDVLRARAAIAKAKGVKE